MSSISITKALNPAYRKFKPLRNDIDKFKLELLSCIEAIEVSDSKNESEEHLKEPIKRFFQNTFFQKNLINTKGRIDLAIYLDETAKSDVGVIIEAKRPSNKTEFVSKDNLNKKALQELLLYYLRERIDEKNNNIKHLIITNGFEWFFFKGEDFYNLFYKNSSLVKEYTEFRDGLKDTSKNELFYDEIASKYIKEVQDILPFVHIEFDKIELNNLREAKITQIYKLFSNVHLLGHSFGNDSNKLNDSFYKELLHIIGLEEVKESSKKIIVRKSEQQRDYASLLENTIFTLEDKDYLHRVKGFSGAEDKAFAVGLELCINWINRILFLKLLESQLVSYNNSNEYRFLNFSFLNGFDALNDLFFSALAKPLTERHPKYKEKFKNIPYLNSSLFEHSALEKQTFDITALKDEEMEIYSSTILKNANGKRLKGKLNTLQYIFLFLEAYDFSADANTEFENEQENKTLINAAVLGLIFEKINGYKDGAFYTPGYITMFMCKEAIRKAVVDKFKVEYNDTIETFEDVKDYCSQYFKKADLIKFNQTINSLKICDPAVGSGHFLVSALNEVISIKSELKILCNEEGNRIPCEISIENDELYVAYNEGELFEYQRNDVNSLAIQKTLFHEKQNVIENCLFGVDINPNSVNICRLRLWIELLKNAYYTSEGELQTLPNIDINIKCGNSLVSRFSLQDGLKSAFKNKEVTYTIEDYKIAVNEYKQTNSKAKKTEVQEIIDTIKSNFKSTLSNKAKDGIDKITSKYETERQRLINLELFGEKIKKAEKDNLKKLKQKADKAISEKEEILNNVIYQDAFEWRFEFPEVLDNEGNFIGFDVIVGNPPYIQLQKMGKASDVLQRLNYLTFARTGDIYSLFYELGNNILRNNGILIFITSNKWMRAAYGESLRKYFIDFTDPLILIDFGGIQIFDSATVDTNILMFAKDKNRQQTKACIVKEKVLNNLSIYFEQFAHQTEFKTNESWVVLSPIEKQIKDKIEAIGTPLKEWDININYGIKTGFNEAFIITGEKRKELIDEDPKSAEIIRPILRGRDIKRYGYDFADLWLINTHNGIKENSLKRVFTEGYSAIKKHLDQYYTQLEKRSDKGDTPYNLRNCAYMEDFSRPKVIYPNMTKFLPFVYDDKGFLTNQKCFIITGEKIAFLTAFLNSSLFKYCFRDNFPELQGGTRELSKVFFDKITVLKVTDEINQQFEKLILNIQSLKTDNKKTTNIEIQVDNIIFDLYDVTIEERTEIGFIEIQ
ncbi:type IIG restriction enzyme/methyltransferase [Myroides odoratimimus]|uniref:type IIG restriction enzyme/methyltransferase n=1 Tax=Myroides odoratimimus TaxID=76832 RepID=UPI001CE0FF7F|nr:Eco57I restriction-modification methylase domain-containing protein [Myroides odoratimimus]MCA4793228.1 class I SAM-dependent DNA methyltransferase [Myroides odoratimimus]MCA4820489.1 class I SAM-dependent DNA methyltransferase [Myroides odoratimimus]